MILFFDRNIGKRLPLALERLGLPQSIEYHQRHFKHDEPDDIWLARVGLWDWIVVSQDYKWHTVKAEAEALKQYRIGCFYLAGASDTRWENMITFAKAYHEMIELAATTPKPFVYWIRKNGRIRREPLP